jgi:hypothetical protein
MVEQPVPSAERLGGAAPSWPDDGEPADTKLPRVVASPGGPPLNAGLQTRLDEAWVAFSEEQYRNIQKMFEDTLTAYMVPYRITIYLYVLLFLMGIVLFGAAVYLGLRDGQSVVAIAFGGLSVGMFLAFFIRQPLQALEEKLELITWLGVAFNTYWVKLMYARNADTVQADVQAAAEAYYTTVQQLVDRHAALREKRPGADVGAG